jgi:nitric oxide synthase-interacting protein
MSRHSKNNTAHAVFTYNEKKRFRNEYGTLTARIGMDSQKKFDQCH